MTSWTVLRLRAIRWLLWRVDAMICSLPRPDRPEGPYFEVWGALGDVHGAVGKLPADLIASSREQPSS